MAGDERDPTGFSLRLATFSPPGTISSLASPRYHFQPYRYHYQPMVPYPALHIPLSAHSPRLWAGSERRARNVHFIGKERSWKVWKLPEPAERVRLASKSCKPDRQLLALHRQLIALQRQLSAHQPTAHGTTSSPTLTTISPQPMVQLLALQ